MITNLRIELFVLLVDGQWRHLFTLNEVSLVLLTGRSRMSRVEDILWDSFSLMKTAVGSKTTSSASFKFMILLFLMQIPIK